MNKFNKINILEIGFTNAKQSEVLEFIVTGLEKHTEKYYIVTPNPELLIIASRQKSYKDILNNAKLALPDGIGVVWASKLIGKPLPERITGVDLVENLCKRIAKRPITAGFLGAGPEVAERCAECLQKKYPGLKVNFALQEWPSSSKNLKADILFVAFGSPKQEIWIHDNLDKLPIKVAVGVGGSFDFISGKVLRAPKLLQEVGLEWLFRLITQPWRIKRQLSLLTFVLLVLRDKFTYKNYNNG